MAGVAFGARASQWHRPGCPRGVQRLGLAGHGRLAAPYCERGIVVLALVAALEHHALHAAKPSLARRNSLQRVSHFLLVDVLPESIGAKQKSIPRGDRESMRSVPRLEVLLLSQ